MRGRTVIALLAAIGSMNPAALPGVAASGADVSRRLFGTMPDGRSVDEFTITNSHRVQVRIISYGAIVTSILVPDRDGTMGDVVHGFDTLDGYLGEHPYFGAVIGRYANRIGNARFTLDGRTYRLAANNGPNHLHGGIRGFDKFVWAGELLPGRAGVVLTRTSPDGEEGYPGTVKARVTYTLTDANALSIEYEATSDRPTPVNLTNHSYFNLAGHGAGDILGHEVTLHADRFTPVDSTLIPTGELAAVQGTPFDFRRPVSIGARIAESHEQLTFGRGYDHNWVLRRAGEGLQPAAHVREPRTGRTLEVATTEPGIQLYTGNFLDGTITGKGGVVYRHRSALCLETQHFPDSPNKPQFPSSILKPGETYRTRTVFTFGIAK